MSMKMTLVRKPLSNPGTIRSITVPSIAGFVLQEVIKKHKEIVEPWELAEDKPDFTAEIEQETDKVIFKVIMTAASAEEATLSVWQLLNRKEGTAVRPMHVSKDWQSKTDPSSPLSSGPGAGHTTGIGFPYDDGIEGRQFDVAVAEDLEKFVDQQVDEAAQRALDVEFGV